MDIFLQLIASGITVGGIYALIALGFVLIYKATSIINFATGEFMMLGAYFCLTLLIHPQFPFLLSFFLTLGFAVLLGILAERLVLRPLIGEPIISVIMVTIGLASILKGLVQVIWGPEEKGFPSVFPQILLKMGPVVISPNYLWGFLIAILCVVIFAAFFKYSRSGVAMRATACDQQVALSMGISVKKILALFWSLGAMAAAIGGMVIGSIAGINLQLGLIGLKIIPVVILGGLDSIGGAILGGFIMGVLENLAGGYLGPVFGGAIKEVAPFVVLVLILMVRPYGLFGKVEIERV
jgi:branched-chain amino acid transport system permease protein